MTSASFLMRNDSAFLHIGGGNHMLASYALIIISGILFGKLSEKIRFPGLFGMILAGILFGPQVLDLINSSVLNMSAEIRKIALLVILIRAGLKLDLEDLKKAGRPAVLMCFVPACFEIAGMVLLAPKLLGITVIEAAVLGAVVGAVSPAVIVPRMIRLIDEGYGTDKSIPQMILAGASVDDVFVIVLFSTFTSLAKGGTVSVMRFVNIPVSVIAGMGIGYVTGLLLDRLFQKTNYRNTLRVLIILAFSFAFSSFEDSFPAVPFASLIAVMAIGIAIRKKDLENSILIAAQFDRIWTAGEIFLFFLVGTCVSLQSAAQAGPRVILLLAGVLAFRTAGVFLCLVNTGLDLKEKIFCMISYLPKATVQAAIGSIPLAMGLSCGEIVLTVSVAAILITAPLGAVGIEQTYRRFLQKSR